MPQASFRLKLSATNVALGSIIRMFGVSMGNKERPLDKITAALHAFVDPVAVFMSDQLVSIHEAPLTVLAGVGIVAGVREHVEPMLGFSTEHRWAEVA